MADECAGEARAFGKACGERDRAHIAATGAQQSRGGLHPVSVYQRAPAAAFGGKAAVERRYRVLQYRRDPRKRWRGFQWGVLD